MSFFGDLIDRVRGEPTVDFTNFYVSSSQPRTFLQPDTQYVRIWLRSARIVDVRRWATKFHAVVHARFNYADRALGQHIACVVAPDKSFQALDPKYLDRFIVVNQPLLGPVPYRGSLSTEVGLFSVAAADLAKPYLDLLADLTNNASVAFLTQAKPFIDPIRRGAEAIFGGDAAQLEIGLSRTDTQLQIGNIVVAKVPKGTLLETSLKLDPNDYRLLNESGAPIVEFPYLVLGIEATTERPDYAQIPEIQTGWGAVRRAAREGCAASEIRQNFDVLRRTLWLSPDLVRADKQRIVMIFTKELADAGYDLGAPAEAVALESLPVPRPLRDAETLLGLRAGGALEAAAPAPARLSVAELQRMMRDPKVSDEELRPYFLANPATSRPFAPSIIPDPARVAVEAPADGREAAVLMDWANELWRIRRQEIFKVRQIEGDPRAVLVAEGDSWFCFPVFLKDIIGNLFDDFNVWSVAAAGDTLQNMVIDNPEYLQALRANRDKVRAFIFSGGGNDIVGADVSGQSVIEQIVKPFEEGQPASWYIDGQPFADRLHFIEDCYRKVISTVAAEFPQLPVLCHGYDHSIPGGFQGDPRHPFWAAKDHWLGKPMRETLKITDPTLQRTIVALMVDRLNERLKTLCGGNNPGGAFPNAYHADLRNTVSTIGLWADELHPTDKGFTLVSSKFETVLKTAVSAAPLVEAAAVERPTPHTGDDAQVHPDERAGEWVQSPTEAVRPWRAAKSLLQLRSQLDARFPGRKKGDDGIIGDATHAAHRSDHNPWVVADGMGVVAAIDITIDPASGCSGQWLADALTGSRDPRIKYVIWNRRICNSSSIEGAAPWTWRPYHGADPHTGHVHLSVKPERSAFDSQQPWQLDKPAGVEASEGKQAAAGTVTLQTRPQHGQVNLEVPLSITIELGWSG
jgi:hypothetical protein